MAVSILFCLCSALSKEQGLTVTAVCLIYDIFVFQKVSKTINYIILFVDENYCVNQVRTQI